MTDWTATASALFAGVGLIFAGQQLLLGNRQAKQDRQLGLDGVVVSWRPILAPVVAESDGTAVWEYEITVTNPGKFAIDQVTVDWVFPCPVRRLRYNGNADAAGHTLQLATPVLPGDGHAKWTRRLRIDFPAVLTDTHAIVTFNDIQGRRRTNTWPRPIKP